MPAPIGDTVRTINGRITYFFHAPQFLGGIDADGRVIPGRVTLGRPTVPSALPNAHVELWSFDGTRLLATRRTNSNGEYSAFINFGPNPAEPVLVRVIAQFDLPNGPDVRVLPNLTATTPYMTQAGPLGSPGQNPMRADLQIDLDEGAGAFHIAATLYDVVTDVDIVTIPDLDVFWEEGNGAESRYVTFEPDLARLIVAGGVAGDPTSNTDVWDRPKLARLYGLYLLNYHIFDVAPPGTPSDELLVPSRAWREGLLDFLACATLGSSIYWDTEGSGPDSRVIRYFDVESFFDSSLGSLGADDPNVYQDPAAVGIASRFTVSEVLWDIHDPIAPMGDPEHNLDQFTFPLRLTMRVLQSFDPGNSYPYFFTLFDAYTPSIIDANILDSFLFRPEDQGVRYPTNMTWPPVLEDPASPGDPLGPGFQGMISDMVDTTQGNVEVGLWSQRYFQFEMGTIPADATASVATPGLRVEILDLSNNVLASGSGIAIAQDLESGTYIIRVAPLQNPLQAAFDLSLRLDP